MQDLVLAVLIDVCQGCVYLHGKNIIWGDCKPENVLLKVGCVGGYVQCLPE